MTNFSRRLEAEMAKQDRHTCKLAELVFIGDEGRPAAGYPLGECEGDYDNNDECEVRKCKRIQRKIC
jgi:hypothetical protein